MAAKKRGLGRGLEALLGASANASATMEAPKAEEAAPVSKEGLKNLPVDLIQRGRYQPRSHMAKEALEELADSIRAQGIVQPIVVRPISENRYEIIAGERRWRAAQLAELQEIPAVIREIPDSAAIAMALIENIQRENLSPLEEAVALKRLIDEFEMTHQGAGEAVGRSRAAVSNLLRLLELEQSVKELVDQGLLEMGHARALLALSGMQQVQAAKHVTAKGMSVRETERYVKQLQRKAERPKITKSVDPDIRRLQDSLSEKLGARVQIQHDRGKGKLVISYNSLDELDGILEKIGD